ncbi:unnamed protein product [Cyprideis torosa]|uniref:Uncharacterized protein n=1 Tax=Cyprideis torosa TaxID=163714 RepID=A0A7R8WKL5_9CRUS|nr:unnamed protein product [Cyprideis torosa]CAG0897102.1 unnamed protein product [Cyprideis torosa]
MLNRLSKGNKFRVEPTTLPPFVDDEEDDCEEESDEEIEDNELEEEDDMNNTIDLSVTPGKSDDKTHRKHGETGDLPE